MGHTKRKSGHMIINLLMIFFIPLLMAYSLIGESLHELAGSAMTVLFLAHNWNNRRWWMHLFQGKYPPVRVFRTVLNLALLVFMVLQPVSGILISKHFYTTIRVPKFTAGAREIHLFCAYWFMVLMCVHAGTHLAVPLRRLRQKNKRAESALIIAAVIGSVYGMTAFVKRDFPSYMTLQQKFVFLDLNQSKLLFFMDYIAIMVLFSVIGLIMDRVLVKMNQRRSSSGRDKMNGGQRG